MKVTRLSKAALFLLVAATLSGTLWVLPSRFRGVVPDQRREATPLSSSVPCSLPHPLSSETRLLASRAIAAYTAAKPLRVSDYFHRWRCDALKVPYPSNLEVQLALGQVQNQRRFRQTFGGSAPLVFRSPYGWEVRQRTPKHARALGVRASRRPISCYVC